MDLFAKIKTALIYPPFLEKVRAVIAECENDHGSLYFATLGFRTYVEQTKLYFQGRTLPGQIVTYARAGESAHNFGLAIDFVHSSESDSLNPDWNNPSYDLLGNIAQSHGLVWGGSWNHPDRPHVQWPGYITGGDLVPFRRLHDSYPNDFLSRCWKLIDDSSTPQVQ